MSAGRFHPVQRALHWLMAAAILAMLFIGVGMVATVSPRYVALVGLHRPLGVLILLLAGLRLAARRAYGAPPLPADLPSPMREAAVLSHVAFYGLMFAMPLLGWAMLSAAAYPVTLWPGAVLPPIAPHSDALHALLWTLHRSLAFAFFALVLLHVAAALFHLLVRRDGVFAAMAPLVATRNARPSSE